MQVFLRIDDGDRTLWTHRGDHPYGCRRAGEVGLPGRTAAVGRRRSPRHLHVHAHSSCEWRARLRRTPRAASDGRPVVRGTRGSPVRGRLRSSSLSRVQPIHSELCGSA
jgi:hypothetical protein